MKYQLRFLEIAKEDKKKIKKYLSQFYPGTPKKFIERLRERLEGIKQTPYMYPAYEYYPDYRRIVVENYLVFYKINEDEKIVEVQRILPGMWDLARYFEGEKTAP